MALKNSLLQKINILPRLVTACLLVALVMAAGPASGEARENALAQDQRQTADKSKKYLDDEDFEVTELWTGKVYSSTYRMGACFSSRGKFRGVLHLRQSNGQVDIYHFYGTIARNLFQASHASGHSFTGELIGKDRLEGNIQLKNGLNISIKGKRQQDVPLDMSDCAPLPAE